MTNKYNTMNQERLMGLIKQDLKTLPRDTTFLKTNVQDLRDKVDLLDKPNDDIKQELDKLVKYIRLEIKEITKILITKKQIKSQAYIKGKEALKRLRNRN